MSEAPPKLTDEQRVALEVIGQYADGEVALAALAYINYLEDEVERVREALRLIVSDGSEWSSPSTFVKVARDALKEDEVKVGQVWASTHRGDIRDGVRQYRTVTQVDGPFVWLHTRGGRHLGSHRTRLSPTGKIPGHRLVWHPHEQEDEG